MNEVELKVRMASLPALKEVGHPPFWSYWQNDLRLNVAHNDPRNLFSFPAVFHCMLQQHILNSIWYEYNDLIQDNNSSKWLSAAVMPNFGAPRDYLKDTEFSANLLHQVYHIKQLADVTGTDITKLDTIVEFGCGYGAMALVLRRLGFTGHYIAYDLPELLLLQKYYLSNTLPSLKDMSFCSSISTLKTHHKQADLLIACGSITEVDYSLRTKFLNSVKFDRFLLMYANIFEKFDNVEWVNNYAHERRDLAWRTVRMSHFPDNAYYTFAY